ncbi:G patch domain-containing protein 4 [Limanda limanda]|uniref:G patch domain-containing protein 4 n=1 Tax=Limanda limanda TaxID=27771 RepID=UPI0029C77BD8|nr:G patch domain-containing protein 4 [Limanda limanda]
MANVVPEKSRGLKFAEQQLLRHGWEQGKGLGREENGICEAIKVNVKCGKGGVGHKEGEQFTFHWWDHVFNKASASLQVESDQDGIKLKKTVEEDEDGMISNKRPRKAWLAKDKLYGCFVKSATLLSGQEQPEPKASDSDDSSSSDEEDDQRLDLSSTTKLSDADLMKACGGRTAHKGARHGLNMSAKLARLEQQEAEFMAKYGKKNQPPAALPVCGKPAPPTSKAAEVQVELPEETADEAPSTKMKKKRKSSTPSVMEVSESPGADVKPKKKKKKKKGDEEITDAVSTEDVICVENCETEHSHKTKRKQKKKNKAEQNEEEITTAPAAESESPEETSELHSVTQVKKKKKKSSSKHHSEVEESNETESSQSELAQDCAPKTKKRKAAVLMEEAEVAEVESTVKQKRTKCKKDKPVMDDKVNEEAPAPKKKKKKCKE